MRKTLEEKIRIVKKATSDKKIKKLAIQYRISTKTIQRWIKQYAKSKLETTKKRYSETLMRKSVSRKAFRNIAFNITKMETPFKGNGHNGFYRLMIKDIDYGFIFAGYSTKVSKDLSAEFLDNFSKEAANYGLLIKKIITPKRVDLSLSSINNTMIVKDEYKNMKKYFTFSLKKNSYMKENTLYDTFDEFLFDSLATIAKNNEFVNGDLQNNKLKLFIKEYSLFTHINNIFCVENSTKKNNSS